MIYIAAIAYNAMHNQPNCKRFLYHAQEMFDACNYLVFSGRSLEKNEHQMNKH